MNKNIFIVGAIAAGLYMLSQGKKTVKAVAKKKALYHKPIIKRVIAKKKALYHKPIIKREIAKKKAIYNKPKIKKAIARRKLLRRIIPKSRRR